MMFLYRSHDVRRLSLECLTPRGPFGPLFVAYISPFHRIVSFISYLACRFVRNVSFVSFRFVRFVSCVSFRDKS